MLFALCVSRYINWLSSLMGGACRPVTKYSTMKHTSA